MKTVAIELYWSCRKVFHRYSEHDMWQADVGYVSHGRHCVEKCFFRLMEHGKYNRFGGQAIKMLVYLRLEFLHGLGVRGGTRVCHPSHQARVEIIAGSSSTQTTFHAKSKLSISDGHYA